MTTIIAVAIQKGGLGKTTITRHVGHCLAQQGLRVLLLDLDPQASLTAITGANTAAGSMADVMGDTEPGTRTLASVIQSLVAGVDIAPSQVNLARAESGFLMRRAREYVLQKAIEPIASNYDFILIDCPPSLGLLLTNALMAAEHVIVPAGLDSMSLASMGLFMETLTDMQSDYPRVAQLLGTVASKANERTVLGREMLNELQGREELRLFKTIIPPTVRIDEAALLKQPIHEYDPTSAAAVAFTALTNEVIERVNH